MFDILIESTGRASLIRDARGRRVTELRARSDIVATSVGTLGCIYLSLTEGGAIVMMRPELVTRPAMISVFDELARTRPQRVLISYGTASGTPEIFADLDSAAARIEELAGGGREGPIRPLFAVQTLPLSNIADLSQGRMLPLLRLWDEAAIGWRSEFYDELRALNLLDCLLAFRVDPGSDDFVISHWGARLKLFGPAWARLAPGRSIDTHPSRNIADRVTATFREVVASAVPRLDEADLVVQSPGGRIVRRHFHRLLLPWCAPGGAIFITVLTLTLWSQMFG